MERKNRYRFCKSFFIFVVVIWLFCNASFAYSKQDDYFSVGHYKTGYFAWAHLKVFFIIPHNFDKVEQKCIYPTAWTNHGDISTWDYNIQYIGGDKDLYTLWVPKSFWWVWSEELASEIVFLR